MLIKKGIKPRSKKSNSLLIPSTSSSQILANHKKSKNPRLKVGRQQQNKIQRKG